MAIPKRKLSPEELEFLAKRRELRHAIKRAGEARLQAALELGEAVHEALDRLTVRQLVLVVKAMRSGVEPFLGMRQQIALDKRTQEFSDAWLRLLELEAPETPPWVERPKKKPGRES